MNIILPLILAAGIDSAATQQLAAVARSLQSARTLHAVTQTTVTAKNAAPIITRREIWFTRSGLIRTDVYDPGVNRPDYTRPAHTKSTICTPAFSMVYNDLRKVIEEYGPDQEFCDNVKNGDAALAHFFRTDLAQPLSYGHSKTTASVWDTTGRFSNPQVLEICSSGIDLWEGQQYNIVTLVFTPAYPAPGSMYSDMYAIYTMRIYIDALHHIRRIVTSTASGDRTVDHVVLSLSLDSPLADSTFMLTPGIGIATKQMPEPPAQKLVQERVAKLVGNSFSALDTSALFLDGRMTTLRKVLNGKKGALLWYWNTECSGCIAEFPHFEQLYRLVKDRGIDVIALDPITLNEEIDSLNLRKEQVAAQNMQERWKTTLPILLSRPIAEVVLKRNLNVVIVDAAGKVVYASLGLEPDKMRLVLENMLGAPLIPD